MRVAIFLLIGALLLSAGGCSSVPFKPTELTPVSTRSAVELSAGLWNTGKGSLLIRQSALFELKGMRFPMAGVMKLDLEGRSARLVGMNDMGVKFYDISVDPAGAKTNFVVPELEKYPSFAEAVATSVRRIFLEPLPSAGDALRLTRTTYTLSRVQEGATLSFLFAGDEPRLLETSCRGRECSWRVRYYQHTHQQGSLVPGGIVLDDDRAGYRLTLWIESVEKSDE